MKSKSSTSRSYRMGERAQTAAETRRRILDAAIQHFGVCHYDEVTLADLARDAGVTVQTVLRRFGSKEGLFNMAVDRGTEDVRKQRWFAQPGDLSAALRGLADHYEEWGDRSLHFLAQKDRIDAIRRLTDAGQALHREWVDHVFEPYLKVARGTARERLRAQLIAVTDVYVWKILRRDLGLSGPATSQAVREIIEAILG